MIHLELKGRVLDENGPKKHVADNARLPMKFGTELGLELGWLDLESFNNKSVSPTNCPSFEHSFPFNMI